MRFVASICVQRPGLGWRKLDWVMCEPSREYALSEFKRRKRALMADGGSTWNGYINLGPSGPPRVRHIGYHPPMSYADCARASVEEYKSAL